MHLANYLTLIRVLISPFFLLLYLQHEWLGVSERVLPFLLIFLLALTELSDAFDGFIARRYNQVTDFGKILDPMADSITRISMFLTFTQGPIAVPLLLVFVFIYRDSVISTLRIICALRGFALAARPSGKIKAILQAVAIFLVLALMIPYSMGDLPLAKLRQWSFWIVAGAALYTLGSGIDYVVANRHYLKKLLAPREAKQT